MSQYSDHLFTPGTQNNSWAHLYEYIKKGDRVLDVGCSSGNFGHSLIELKQCQVIGIDLDKKDIVAAKKVLTEAHVMDINNKGDMSKLGAFDVIIFADVIEHLVAPRQTLKGVKGMLKEDGRVIFSVPHMGHMSVRLDLLKGIFPYKEKGLLDRTHLHFYDKDQIHDTFSDAGYHIERVDPVISEYPESLIDKKLQEVGLKSTDEFIYNLRETKANIFQFVGCARPAKDAKRNVKKDVRYTMPQDEVMAYAKEVLKENRRLWQEQQATEQSNQELRHRLSRYTSLMKPLRPLIKGIKNISKGIQK